MRDPYAVLGVARSASEKDIKSAYRKLAKAHHPDQNKNDPKAQAKFAEASNAYEFLTDKEKRGQFDRGEIDASGTPKFAGFGFPGGGRRRAGGTGGINPEDILKEFMGGGGGRRAGGAGGQHWDPFAGAARGSPSGRGHDLAVTAVVSLEDAHHGASVPLKLPGGRTVSLKIPNKVEDGQQVRLKGQGQASPLGGTPGDMLVTIKFATHKVFRRDGHDLRADVPITLYEAVLGAKVRVPTLDGPVELNLPPGVDTAKSLRLKAKGLYASGDLYANLRIVLPKGGDADLESLMRFWRDQKPYSVRD